jgi:chaperonin GroES
VSISGGGRGIERGGGVTAGQAAHLTTALTHSPSSSHTTQNPKHNAKQRTAGGILLPSAPPKANSDAHFGEVLAVGGEVKLGVAPGDVIVYNKYAMAEVEVPEGEVVFVAEKSVLGKLE